MGPTETAFSAGGALARAIPGYVPRTAQLTMAKAVSEAIEIGHTLLVEAGTGTGKTFAYLVPALLSGKKVILSTGTRALQEQLYYRDLPLIRDALGEPRTVALLKGRANYLCLHRMEQALTGQQPLADATWQHLYQVQHWAAKTAGGDIGEVGEVPDNSPVWPLVTSTADNCLAKDCPQLARCWVKKAREAAMQADLVVINHHLFFADMALRDTGFGELLPQGEIFIFDEAHQLPDIASDYFGQHLSSRQLLELARDSQFEYSRELADMRQLNTQAERLKLATRELRLLLEPLPSRGQWPLASRQRDGQLAVERLYNELRQLRDVLKLALGRSELIDHCYERAVGQLSRLALFSEVADVPQYSLWYEINRHHFSLHQSPLSVAERFNAFVAERGGSWVFTSATLALADDFAPFASRLGVSTEHTLLLPGPFDYRQQALLCVPRHLPPPTAAGSTEQILSLLLPLIRDSGGRCFLLFTSQRAMQAAADWFAQHWQGPLLIQGSQSKRQLLRRFVDQADALLLGLASFWEGVDVQGRALCCVIIDKLPFAAPDDPLLKARMAACRNRDQDPFVEIQLPQAVLALKQGAGRLIRGTDDQGVLVVTDPRLVSKAYGQAFLRSLPPMARTRSLARTRAFLQQIAATADTPVVAAPNQNPLGEVNINDNTSAGN